MPTFDEIVKSMAAIIHEARHRSSLEDLEELLSAFASLAKTFGAASREVDAKQLEKSQQRFLAFLDQYRAEERDDSSG